jgi:hypothetical protein
MARRRSTGPDLAWLNLEAARIGGAVMVVVSACCPIGKESMPGG